MFTGFCKTYKRVFDVLWPVLAAAFFLPFLLFLWWLLFNVELSDWYWLLCFVATIPCAAVLDFFAAHIFAPIVSLFVSFILALMGIKIGARELADNSRSSRAIKSSDLHPGSGARQGNYNDPIFLESIGIHTGHFSH